MDIGLEIGTGPTDEKKKHESDMGMELAYVLLCKSTM